MRVKEHKPTIKRIPCPHCEHKTRIRKTREFTPIYREITCQCLNDKCGCVFVCAITPVRILTPSAAPNPDVHIPLSEHVNVQQLVLSLNEPVKRA